MESLRHHSEQHEHTHTTVSASVKQHIDNNETEHTNNQKTQTFIHDPDDSRIKNKNHEPNLKSNINIQRFKQVLKSRKCL